MNTKLCAADMLDREFLEIRCRLLDIAAAMDRIDRAEGAQAVRAHPRVARLSEAAGILVDGQPERAKRVQMLFSDPYDPAWQDEGR